MEIPSHLRTNKPHEAISYGIGLAIKDGVIAPNFKMNAMAWQAIENYLIMKWCPDAERIAQMIECFTTGYAIGSNQEGVELRRMRK